MFHVGQHVVCVDDQWRDRHKRGLLKKGSVYTVMGWSTVQSFYYGSEIDTYGALLDEVKNPIEPDSVVDIGFAAHRFRPLQDSRLDIFRHLLVNPPKRGVDA